MSWEREAELEILVKMALTVGERPSETEKFSGFMAMVGQKFSRDHELMVIGRAVNGWGSGNCADSVKSDDGARSFAKKTLCSVTSEERCPMLWVSTAKGKKSQPPHPFWGERDEKRKEYNTNRSAFWRAIGRVVHKLHKIEGILSGYGNVGEWPSCLLWSNLFKISPHEGGNPSTGLRRKLFNDSIKLIELEVALYKPKRLLFLTGYEWAKPFVVPLVPRIEERDSFHVKAVGITADNSTKIVVATHPQGKFGQDWAKDVIHAFTVG